LLHALLLDRRLVALTLGRFRRFDAHTRFALGTEACFLDLALVITLRLDLGVLFFAAAALCILLRTEPRLFGTADRVLFFLDAVLLDLTELAEGKQN
jgi:hypothetical protein